LNKDSENKSSNQFLKMDGGKTKPNSIEIPSISLPKGGGAIKGIDEKFSVNAVNGTASFSIPIPVSPARGVGPNLTLSYNSGGGNSVFGLGWSLGLSSIKRKTDKKLPKYFDSIDSDTYLFSEAEDLVPEFRKEDDGSFSIDTNDDYIIKERVAVESPNKTFIVRYYKPRIEGLFARIERWTNKNSGEIKWRIISKDNITTLYGWSGNSRLSDPQDDKRVFEWMPEFVFDDKGNCTVYKYKHENNYGLNFSKIHNKNRYENGVLKYSNIYLEKILYCNKTPYKNFGDAIPPETDFLFETVLDYGSLLENDPPDTLNEWDFRNDAFSEYKSGFEIRTTRLCKRILLFHHFSGDTEYNGLVKSLNFEYDTSIQIGFTFLKAISSYGYIKKPDGTYSSKKLPDIEFEYQKHEWNSEVKTISRENLVHSPAGLDEPTYLFTDLFNEGLSGILTEQGNGWYYKHNLGDGRFEQAKLISRKPSFSGLGNQLQLADLDADGGKQFVGYNNEPKGYFELSDDDEWQPFKNFVSLPNIDFLDPNARMIDLNGDGISDLLITEENVFTWYESIGRKGFNECSRVPVSFDEEKGPYLAFADLTQSIYLSDMSGDGLADIVRIRNGEVCYWPNLGYGKFGSKITMDNSPTFDNPDAFNPSYIRLSDIDGSGTTDVIYLGKNKFSCWMNLSGNEFSLTPFEIAAFPDINNKSQVTVTDLLGNGIACIVWSSNLEIDSNSPLRYIDLMNSKKPHIMISYKNNLGKEVFLEYTASTKFYIEDKLAGKPWVTMLHFPVHCISKSESHDKISGHRFVTSYKYHHGYYDHPEREFRGFGMVEQIDTEDFEHFIKGNSSNVVDRTLYQAPVLQKTWFHTGAFLSKDKILNQFSHEYWYEEFRKRGLTVTTDEYRLPDGKLITGPGLEPNFINSISPQEWREALRALKGLPLRTEIFALDAPLINADDEQLKKQLTPYTVSDNNYFIEILQPKGKNNHAVFIVKESESLTYNYERNTDDPRIAHNLNIKIDEYGNILESASVVYPRKNPDSSIPVEIRNEQDKTTIIYIQSDFTNDTEGDNFYRLRLPSEIKTYELKGVANSGEYYKITDFESILNNSEEAEYYEFENEPTNGTSQKRLIENIRTIYYKNDLSGSLPLHILESRALTFENYQLAYTPQLLTNIFDDKVNDDIMEEGKFTHSEGDSNWWIRSGTIQYTDTGFVDAQNRFFMPVSYTDPYGSITKIKYYSDYNLFIQQTEDALGNKTVVDSFNFRTLTPQKISDINNNKSEVLLDELGLPKAMAVMGKGSEADDLTGLFEFRTDDDDNLVTSYFSPGKTFAYDPPDEDAANLLKHSTARFIYDYDRYKNSGGIKPPVTATILREEHYSSNPLSKLQISFEYSNGIGKVAMKKVQAEPGLAKKVTVNPNDSIIITDIDTSVTGKLRWLGTGKTVLNNKGNPVKKYEPYFSDTHEFESYKELIESGVTPVIYYDAPGRVIKTEYPDGTFSMTEFDSWKQLIYDQNDTVKESTWYSDRGSPDPETEAEPVNNPVRRAAWLAAQHSNTPTEHHFDTLGRPVLQIENNGTDALGNEQLYLTIAYLDIEGNLLSIKDARENTVMSYKYDMLGNQVYQDSMDAGKRWMFNNILGNSVRKWDEREHEFRFTYDILHRPLESIVIGGDGSALLNNVYERIVYGEGETNPEVLNLRGRPIKYFDTAGLIETPEYDFSGQPKYTKRSLFKDYKSVADWNTDINYEDFLESEQFIFTTELDAIGRIKKQTAPDGSIIFPSYNESGLLNSEKVEHPDRTEEYIKNIDYNEKGQRTKIIYGNDVKTEYIYDNKTFRLRNLETKRIDNSLLQKLSYIYDPTGNITTITDDAVPTVFFNNMQFGGVNNYKYDALYRLTEATGRENDSLLQFDSSDNWNDAPYMHNRLAGDPMTIRGYTQTYQYDPVGNILQMKHSTSNTQNNWTRDYEYESASNRLIKTIVGTQTYLYPHHVKHGYITAMPHLEDIGWNFKEEVIRTIRQRRTDGGTPETTYYQYDSQGQRVRKVTENQADAEVIPTIKEERIYISGYELYKKHTGNDAGLKRTSLSLMDKEHRFVMIETRNDIEDGTEEFLVRYQHHNHLGSANLELNENADVISYEEYHPYGTTAYQAKNSTIKSTAKRYRYTGMERDEESGLEYHSARYYLSWLGRWLNADPIGIKDGLNLYSYVKNNSLLFNDIRGTQSSEVKFRSIGQVTAGLSENQAIAQFNAYEGKKQGIEVLDLEKRINPKTKKSYWFVLKSKRIEAENLEKGLGAGSNYVAMEAGVTQAIRNADNINKGKIGENAAKVIDNLPEADKTISTLEEIAKETHNARNASREASQSKLLPLGKLMSKIQDSKIWRSVTNNSKSFEAILNRKLLTVGGSLKEAYIALAKGASKGRESSTKAAKIFGKIGQIFGGIGGILSAYSLYKDIGEKNYGVMLGDATGIVAGAYSAVGAATNPVGLVAGGISLSNIAGDYLEKKITPSYGRGVGVSSGTVAGVAIGATLGAAIGVGFFGIGAVPGAIIGGAIGGISAFIGSYW